MMILRFFGLSFAVIEASAVRAITPPSPRLFALMIMTAYLSATTNISDQNIKDKTPNM